jgi:hypothetical protein
MSVNAWLNQLSVDTKRLGSFPATGSYCSFAAPLSFPSGWDVGSAFFKTVRKSL